mgnify:CR=1 FL=1
MILIDLFAKFLFQQKIRQIKGRFALLRKNVNKLSRIFLRLLGMNKNKYLDKLRELGDKGKGLYMHHRDREELYKYLQGGAAPPNLERRTRRELNPEQYVEAVPSKKAKMMDDRYSLDKMRREEDRDLKARMQLHMLENQQRQQPSQVLQMQQPIMTASSSAMQDSRRSSRFDMTMHPNQGPQGPPGVFVPQQNQPMTLDQGDPWARNQGGPRWSQDCGPRKGSEKSICH